jgi:hypothetical protein
MAFLVLFFGESRKQTCLQPYSGVYSIETPIFQLPGGLDRERTEAVRRQPEKLRKPTKPLSEFIENADAGPTQGRSAEEIKQDCELKALRRSCPGSKSATRSSASSWREVQQRVAFVVERDLWHSVLPGTSSHCEPTTRRAASPGCPRSQKLW